MVFDACILHSHDHNKHTAENTKTDRAGSCSSTESPNGGALPEVEAFQDTIFASTAKQSVRAGDAAGIDAGRFGGKRR